jgi:hypothetical protein
MIDAIVAAYRALPSWLQYWVMRLLVAVVAALIASTWMHVAVYAYATRYAARYPLEGVSFVALLGGLAGFLFILVSMFLFYELPRELRKFHVIIIEENITCHAHIRQPSSSQPSFSRTDPSCGFTRIWAARWWGAVSGA